MGRDHFCRSPYRRRAVIAADGDYFERRVLPELGEDEVKHLIHRTEIPSQGTIAAFHAQSSVKQEAPDDRPNGKREKWLPSGISLDRQRFRKRVGRREANFPGSIPGMAIG